MPKFIESPSIIESAGNLPKKIEEFVGRVNTENSQISIARMTSPEGWLEPGQRPEFQEITVVLEGTIVVEFEGGMREIRAGSAIVAEPGEWVRYSTPKPGGAKYIAICLPAFSPDMVHRDRDN